MKNVFIRYKTTVGYVILTLLMILQQVGIFIHVYQTQTYTGMDLLISILSLTALIFGILVPSGVTAVSVFVFMVAYFVWLVTLAEVDFVSLQAFLWIPGSMVVASVIREGLIQQHRLMERMEVLRYRNPEIDVDTTLGNKGALKETLVKHANLANRYEDKYHFCVSMFKIEFLPLVRERLGSQGYSELLLELSETIQKHIRYEDYKFYVDKGRFVVLLPLTRHEYLKSLNDRIKLALMDVKLANRKDQELNLIIRSGALVFSKEQFSGYEDLEAVIAALERNAETDLIGEYI
ncbi:GGDEF domain-containing protein [Paenibacillus sp. Marseille-Q4541]|uniref:GGDEF domain-containing protein n=1 Tax=Paenibacillus sp. Marseille-Q4541 TaxID=2831522 RepID=UPI001BA83A41|nr:GGDEF domain-containing protein [Paenibacillus sp. Marseille-Q4541]